MASVEIFCRNFHEVQHNCHVLRFGAELFVLIKGWCQHLKDGFLKWKKISVATKGKPSSCLKACATDIKSMAEVLVNLPAGQDDMNAYLTFKDVRAKFKDEKPPACEKDCWNKTSSSSADETGIVDKFHDIWNVAKVGNMQINYIFPWPDSDDDDNIL
ncbi:unnamed protein product [Miscanthus lutarioriparius]|uniref:Uncharacterized protein n=1 Tax=Miscanthus lutarioriparius TaxID=422564 RepID=A0A811QGG2_9POAL|nr:unnamed protein product [Miscanthus lutarioriparius]